MIVLFYHVILVLVYVYSKFLYFIAEAMKFFLTVSNSLFFFVKTKVLLFSYFPHFYHHMNCFLSSVLQLWQMTGPASI